MIFNRIVKSSNNQTIKHLNNQTTQRLKHAQGSSLHSRIIAWQRT
ncbi:hypothetical protein HMPREF3204_00400 [Gardnerella pickettii]|nr:hypothetical protein HMPREF3204_00400 [Gardnerella pickettii]